MQNLSNLELLYAGEKITDGDEVYIFKGISIENSFGVVTTHTVEAINDKDHFDLFLTEEQKEIRELRAIINKQKEVIEDLSKPKHKRRRILDADEKEDLITQFKRVEAKEIKQVHVADMFKLSSGYVSRKYKAWKKGEQI